MGQKEELKDLDLQVDDVIDYLDSLTLPELEKEKRLWEERICNDEIDSLMQGPRLRVLRSINEEIGLRK